MGVDGQMRTSMRVRFGLGVSLAAFLGARGAGATTVLELGENGSEQMARGGAWVARASDPLATFYNPAGLAGQETRLTLQGNINIQSTCFTRLKAPNDGTAQDGNLSAASSTVAPGQYYPQVCNNAFAPTTSNGVVPQIGITYRVTPRLGLGFVFVTPSAAAASQTWPSTVDGGPAPQRYLLLSGAAVVVTPTLGVGWEPIDNLRIGASFMWGIANIDFQNDSWATNSGLVGSPANPSPANNDIKGEISVSNYFVPGFTLGAIWTPVENLDIAGWYKFMSTIDAKGSVKTTFQNGGPGNITDTTYTDCGTPGGKPLCSANSVEMKIPIPMEAKLGVRYHKPRAGVPQEHRRDPLATDAYDLEADFTWANDSSFSTINISLPTIPVNINGVNTLASLPANASIPNGFQDVFGVHVGGDYNLISDALAIRAGGYFQTAAQPAEYQNLDFVGQWEAGFALGATYRLHLAGAPKKNAIEISAGFGHTFIGTSSYTTNDPQHTGVHALSGTPCNGQVQSSGSAPTGSWSQANAAGTNGNCTDGVQQDRSEWPVNLGTITNSFNQINLGASYRF
jgi:long-subunit fatty acid transport protein